MTADIVAYDSKNNPVLLVEVKNQSNAPNSWAKQLRRNILSHGTLPDVKYFLLVLPDKFYLWKDAFDKKDADPNYVENTEPILKKYFSQSWSKVKTISEDSFEIIISTWLRDIIHSDFKNSDIKNQKWLIDSGLYKSLKGGSFIIENIDA